MPPGWILPWWILQNPPPRRFSPGGFIKNLAPRGFWIPFAVVDQPREPCRSFCTEFGGVIFRPHPRSPDLPPQPQFPVPGSHTCSHLLTLAHTFSKDAPEACRRLPKRQVVTLGRPGPVSIVDSIYGLSPVHLRLAHSLTRTRPSMQSSMCACVA